MTAVLLSIALLGGAADTPMGILPAAEPPGPERSYKPRHEECNTRACDRRVDRKVIRRRVQKRHKAAVRWRAHQRKVVRPYRGWLYSTRMCESGGRYAISTGNGFYGAYQFTLSSWHAVGGYGMPHLNQPLEQDYRAVRLLHVQGRGAWPHCG